MTTTNVVQLSSITPHPSVEYWSVCKVEALFETPFRQFHRYPRSADFARRFDNVPIADNNHNPLDSHPF